MRSAMIFRIVLTGIVVACGEAGDVDGAAAARTSRSRMRPIDAALSGKPPRSRRYRNARRAGGVSLPWNILCSLLIRVWYSLCSGAPIFVNIFRHDTTGCSRPLDPMQVDPKLACQAPD